MSSRSHRHPSTPLRRSALATAVVLALAGAAAQAQVSSATVKGQVVGGTTQAGVTVTAVNTANGASYRTQTRADGSYVLLGLAPGAYEITLTGANGAAGHTERVILQVGETAAIDLRVGAAPSGGAAEQVVVVGSANRQNVKDSQVGTNVSRRMIEAMPQSTRNFMSSADLAPGVAFGNDTQGNTSVQSGAQNYDAVNVFIDGVGQKNNILRGGLVGQDTSRGNPFPQSAIAEYKVLTQNYKAEFDQVSSAAITAVTKSGTNEFHGDVYVDRTGTNWRAKSPFEKEKEAAGIKLQPSEKYEYGVSLGGPIVENKAHFFFAYDAKRIDDSRQTKADNLDKFPDQTVGVLPTLAKTTTSRVMPFLEHLLFGKLDAEVNDENRLSLSMKLRRESDRRLEDDLVSGPGNEKERKNNETRIDLKHEWTRGPWLSEARVGYEDYRWNPHSNSTDPFVKYKYSSATPPRLDNSQNIAYFGGSPDAQNRNQKGWTISEDLSYTGFNGHAIKGGLKVKAMRYELAGTAFAVDTVETVVDTVTGLPYFDGSNCLGTNITNNGNNSDQCKITRALDPVGVKLSNTQVGLYLQDDWSVTKKLELNLGVRWDYETNMLNNDYVTPADRVAALMALDTRTDYGPIPAGQTYAQSLAKGGININDYISTGKSRKAFTGAFAPRLGFSYDVMGNRQTVVYGGWGRSYDRTIANNSLDELQKNKQAGGEIWLIRNEFKVPFSDQLTLGIRQALSKDWNGEIAISHVDAKNQFVWFGGNRDPQGGYWKQSPMDPLWGGPSGYGTLVLGDFVGRTRTDSIFVKAEKPYTASSGWSASIAFTYSDAKTTSREWKNDIFDWTYGRTGRTWNPSTLVDGERIVGAFMTDKLPWGMTLGLKGTWASGQPRRITSCAAGWDKCVSVKGEAPSFRQVDLSLSKAFKYDANQFTLRADILNLFGTRNYGGFDDWGGGPVAPGGKTNAYGGDNLNVGKPNSIRGDNRTLRVMLGYKF